MKIKTYPLQFAECDLDRIREAAAAEDVSMKEYMLAAIFEKLEKNSE